MWTRSGRSAFVKQVSAGGTAGGASVISSFKWKECSDLSERSCSCSIAAGGVLLNVRWSLLFTPFVCHRFGLNNKQFSLLKASFH